MISCDPFADEGGRAGTAVGCTGQQQMMLMELHGHAVKIQYRKLRIVLREKLWLQHHTVYYLDCNSSRTVALPPHNSLLKRRCHDNAHHAQWSKAETQNSACREVSRRCEGQWTAEVPALHCSCTVKVRSTRLIQLPRKTFSVNGIIHRDTIQIRNAYHQNKAWMRNFVRISCMEKSWRGVEWAADSCLVFSWF